MSYQDAVPNENTNESSGEECAESNGCIRIFAPIPQSVPDETIAYSYTPNSLRLDGNISQSEDSEKADTETDAPHDKKRCRPSCTECGRALYTRRVNKLAKIIEKEPRVGQNHPRLQRNGIYGVLKR